MTKKQRNEYVHVRANKNIEQFFFSLITYVWISVKLINLAAHWKTNTLTTTKTWLTNNPWWYFEKEKKKNAQNKLNDSILILYRWQTKVWDEKCYSESETKIKLSRPDWSSCKFS